MDFYCIFCGLWKELVADGEFRFPRAGRFSRFSPVVGEVLSLFLKKNYILVFDIFGGVS